MDSYGLFWYSMVMARPLRFQDAGLWYHVTNRGKNREDVLKNIDTAGSAAGSAVAYGAAQPRAVERAGDWRSDGRDHDECDHAREAADGGEAAEEQDVPAACRSAPKVYFQVLTLPSPEECHAFAYQLV